MYYGRDYTEAIDSIFETDYRIQKVSTQPIETTAKLLAQGKVAAIYTNKMEYGPRALGARSILAAPTDANINDTLNKRLGRTEFMPFAPVVAEEDVEAVFELINNSRYATQFMTITCKIRPEWRDKVPAVVHVDNTARPQTIRRETNPLYFDILAGYKKQTGIPVLINTSFNIHEQPIINSPSECVNALAEDRVDYVVTEKAVYGKMNSNCLTKVIP